MIVSLFAQGVSNRDIESQMKRIYGIDVSPEMVSRMTDKILPLAKGWQNRPLNEMYPIIYLDGIVFNVNQDGQIVKKTAYVVFAITTEGCDKKTLHKLPRATPSVWSNPIAVCPGGNARA